LENESLRAPYEGRFPVNAGISGYVAATADTVNIVDAYEDSRFDPAVDVGTDFRHRSVLCMPIVHSGAAVTASPTTPGSVVSSPTKDKKGVLGVFQLVNKFEELPFTKNDENFVEAFAIFCGMGISNVNNYERAIVAMAKQQVRKKKKR